MFKKFVIGTFIGAFASLPAVAATNEEILARLDSLERSLKEVKSENAALRRKLRIESAAATAAPAAPAVSVAARSTPQASYASVGYNNRPMQSVNPTWSGFYLGIDGGVTRHDARVTDVNGALISTGLAFITNKTGGIAGGYAGYNWQHRGFVYGFEGDLNWVGAKAQQIWGAPFITSVSFPQSQDIAWLATFRGRAGIDFDSTLFYLTGGIAVAGVKESLSANCPAGIACAGVGPGGVIAGWTNNTTKVGWTMGTGFEHMFDSHWTLRGEFRYVDLGRSTVRCADSVPGNTSCSAPAATADGEFSNTLMIGMAGIGYKF